MNGSPETIVIKGTVHSRRGSDEGYAVIEDRVVSEIGFGQCPVRPDFRGTILDGIINSHTHCADFGLDIPDDMSLEDLVAPPDGLKHRYLRETPDEVIGGSMRAFSSESRIHGTSAFIDFREGGVAGCRLLRDNASDAVILGRPVSEEFDSEEIESILDVADGIGLPSISDMDHSYVEAVADAVRERRKMFAIHASERIREDIDFILSLDPAFVVHMCEATDSDLCKCAEAEVPIVVCPTSNLYFGKMPPIARAQRCGADLAIGTDNGMLCPPDMVSEADVFGRLAELQGGDPEGVWNALFCLAGKVFNGSKTILDTGGSINLAILLEGSEGISAAHIADCPVILTERKKRL